TRIRPRVRSASGRGAMTPSSISSSCDAPSGTWSAVGSVTGRSSVGGRPAAAGTMVPRVSGRPLEASHLVGGRVLEAATHPLGDREAGALPPDGEHDEQPDGGQSRADPRGREVAPAGVDHETAD